MINYTKLFFRSVIYHKFGNQKPVVRVNIFGFTVVAHSFAELLELTQEIFIKQSYYFEADNNKTPYIIDCGSHIGLSILYFKSLFPDSKILAFEPDSKNTKLLEQNLQENGISGVQIQSYALSNREGPMFLSIKEGASVNSTLFSGQQTLGENVTIKKLSSFIDNVNVDFLKIDIEGSEREVINDLTSYDCWGKIQKFAIEFHDRTKDEIDITTHQLMEFGFNCARHRENSLLLLGCRNATSK